MNIWKRDMKELSSNLTYFDIGKIIMDTQFFQDKYEIEKEDDTFPYKIDQLYYFYMLFDYLEYTRGCEGGDYSPYESKDDTDDWANTQLIPNIDIARYYDDIEPLWDLYKYFETFVKWRYEEIVRYNSYNWRRHNHKHARSLDSKSDNKKLHRKFLLLKKRTHARKASKRACSRRNRKRIN